MGAMSRIVASIAGLGVMAAVSSAMAAAPAVITLDGAELELAKQKVEAGDASVGPAYDALIASADKVLDAKADSVTYKGLTPPSGDKHDYMSIGPYWWPDPSKPDGLPYIRKDGDVNPSAKNDDTDSRRIQRMCQRVKDLSLAYFFTGKTEYAEKTAEAIKVWFLDPETRMNPNLRFGQAVPGIVDGRGIGLIDTRNFWMVIDAVALIEPADVLSAEDVSGLKGWFRDFSDWMITNPQGHEESTWHNNHGTYYDAQIVNYALFTGQTELAKQTLADAVHRRMAAHFAQDGKQYAELERTRPFHYSAFNLQAHMQLARYGEEAGVDYGNAVQDGRTLKAGVDYLLPFLKDPKSWPYEDKTGVQAKEVLPVILMAARAWPEQKDFYADYLKAVPADLAKQQDYLFWPLN